MILDNWIWSVNWKILKDQVIVKGSGGARDHSRKGGRKKPFRSVRLKIKIEQIILSTGAYKSRS